MSAMVFLHQPFRDPIGFDSLDGLHDWVLCCARGNAATGRRTMRFYVLDDGGAVRLTVYGYLRYDSVPVWCGDGFECIDARWTSALWPDGVTE